MRSKTVYSYHFVCLCDIVKCDRSVNQTYEYSPTMLIIILFQLGDIHKCLMTYYNGMCSKECNQVCMYVRKHLITIFFDLM